MSDRDQLLQAVLDEFKSTREEILATRHSLNNVTAVTVQVNSQLERFLERFDEHSERLDQASLQVAHLERQAAAAKYWLAGASAAIAGLFGIAMWVASNVPEAVIQRMAGGR